MTDKMTIKTNNQSRDILYWHDLTAAEQAEFDYLDSDDERNEASFFRYKGRVYDLGEFMVVSGLIAPHPQHPGWEKWDGYASDSYFSGILVRFMNNCESVIVATYYC